ncbi:MAG TPA: hypothetical protein VGQ65_15990, partial [Thermoanaerobaculia bacterium]|nr:hypothetical protein [Thermoanaerobaculia bacterium]
MLATERWRPRRLAWLRLAASLSNARMSLETQHLRKPPIRQRDAAEPAGEDASVPTAHDAQALKL